MNLRKYISVIGCCAVLSASAVNDGYTNQDVWSAYEGFNKTFLDSKKYIYKTDTSFPEAVDRWKGAAAIWCQPMYWDMSMNAYRLACKQGDKKRKKEFKELSRKIFEGNKAQYAGFNFMTTMKIPAGLFTTISSGGPSHWHVLTSCSATMNI